jgi:hypothetical protein
MQLSTAPQSRKLSESIFDETTKIIAPTAKTTADNELTVYKMKAFAFLGANGHNFAKKVEDQSVVGSQIPSISRITERSFRSIEFRMEFRAMKIACRGTRPLQLVSSVSSHLGSDGFVIEQSQDDRHLGGQAAGPFSPMYKPGRSILDTLRMHSDQLDAILCRVLDRSLPSCGPRNEENRNNNNRLGNDENIPPAVRGNNNSECGSTNDNNSLRCGSQSSFTR